MATRATGRAANSTDPGIMPAQMMQLGKEQTDAMLNVHKELLDAYQEAGQAWVNRVKSEVEFWSELATKLAASRSVPDGLEAYRDGISHRMQMAAEDGRRMFEDGQKVIAAMTNSVSNGFSTKAK
jgi:Phasin protein